MSDEKPPREKKSWRDIDAKRDRSQSPAPRGSDGDLKRKLQDAHKSKQYRAALDALFEKGGFDKVAEALGKRESGGSPAPANPSANSSASAAPVESAVGATSDAIPVAGPGSKGKPSGDDRLLLRKKILEAAGRDEISRAVDKFIAKWPLPDDWEVLEQVLEHQAAARVDEALAKLEAMVMLAKPRRARTLVGKLRYIEETSGRAEWRERASKLRAKLG